MSEIYFQSRTQSEKMRVTIDLGLATQTSKNHRFGLIGSGKRARRVTLEDSDREMEECVLNEGE